MKLKVLQESWTNKQLLVTFVILLLFFSVLRWDAGRWLEMKINSLIVENKVDVSYKHLSLHITGIELTDVRLRSSGLPAQLHFDRVYLNVDWASLWTMRLAVLVDIKNDFIQVNASVSKQGDEVEIHGLTGDIDVAALQTWLAYPLLVHASGAVRMHGDVALNISTAAPTALDISVAWLEAEVNVMSQVHALGDYTAQLTMHEQQVDWKLEGGKQLALQGQGSVAVSTSTSLQWPLMGEVEVRLDSQSSLAKLTHFHDKKIQLSGELGSPQWH